MVSIINEPPIQKTETRIASTEGLPARERRVHIIGAGPVGLLLAALLQSMEGLSVRLYEKRSAYTRTRMVKLAPYLVADSLESYRVDHIDGESIAAIFDDEELEGGLAFRQSIPSDLMSLLRNWVQGFCPLNTIEQTLSSLIDERASKGVQRIATMMKAEEAVALLEPGDLLIDCNDSNSLLRDRLATGSASGQAGANTLNIQLEYAVVITFLYGQPYLCNEYCKYNKNAGNVKYKFIPAVDRIAYDGDISHVTGIVNVTAEDYESMPPKFDGQWMSSHFPELTQSMERFINKIKEETPGEILGDLEMMRIPLNLYRARNATSRKWRAAGPSEHPFASSPVFLAGDSAIGSPYFQSISMGFECAMYLAGLIAQPDLPVGEMLDRYELYIYKQWLRVYMRSKMIKHNKDLFESLDDTPALLKLLHIY